MAFIRDLTHWYRLLWKWLQHAEQTKPCLLWSVSEVANQVKPVISETTRLVYDEDAHSSYSSAAHQLASEAVGSTVRSNKKQCIKYCIGSNCYTIIIYKLYNCWEQVLRIFEGNGDLRTAIKRIVEKFRFWCKNHSGSSAGSMQEFYLCKLYVFVPSMTLQSLNWHVWRKLERSDGVSMRIWPASAVEGSVATTSSGHIDKASTYLQKWWNKQHQKPICKNEKMKSQHAGTLM